MYDRSLVTTEVAAPYSLAPAEAARILESLRRNGVAALRGFIPAQDAAQLHDTAETATTPGFIYGESNKLSIKTAMSEGTRDFSHPFLVSATAARIVTTGALLDLVEKFLGDRPIIHHGLLQRSLPLEDPILDWHIDCGSNKSLNGIAKFPDVRLRSILYLSDVESGGLGYILDSASEALPVFMPLHEGELFPSDKVPTDPERQVAMNERAGTLILFNTHGLHRPEVPKKERLVMNVWFARRDFSARLPAVMFSLSNVPAANRDRLYVFDNERGPETIHAPKPVSSPSVIRRLIRRVAG
ncbi:MAG TPA: hypothetical protein VFC38_07375 [Stellaceae bacterium]|nr:hypothetical protein [Stellaceae bacterium]